MSTLISNPKVNDESLRGYVKPMPPPPALALAHEVWRATRDGGDTAAARDALEKLTALAERRVVPIPIKGIVPKGECLVTKDERKKQRRKADRARREADKRAEYLAARQRREQAKRATPDQAPEA